MLSNFYYDNAGSLFALDKGGVRYYVATDRVGTPKVVTDATGVVVKFLEFDSFGMPTFDSNPDFNLPVGFAGGLTDDKTGLVRFGYRDYEPGTGRWTVKDPIFFGGGQGNLYDYVQNNPVNLIDPFGLCSKKRGPLEDMAKGFTFGVMASGVIVWESGKMAVIDATKAALSELLGVPFILDKAYAGYEGYQNVTHEYRDIGERVGDRIQRLKDWWYNGKDCSDQCK